MKTVKTLHRLKEVVIAEEEPAIKKSSKSIVE